MVIFVACEDEKIGGHWPLTTPYLEQVLYIVNLVNKQHWY